MSADLTVLDPGGERAFAVLQRAGAAAAFAADEFFAARIANPHTGRAYARAVGRFLAWADRQEIELARVTPRVAGRFMEELAGVPVRGDQVSPGFAPRSSLSAPRAVHQYGQGTCRRGSRPGLR